MAAMVGRAAELAEIERALETARGGQAQLLLVTGPAGIGKSRLAAAAADRAGDFGIALAAGYAIDDPGAPPLWPWTRAMRGWPVAAEFATAAASGADPAARFALFLTVAEAIRGRGPLLVLLEDMHWADEMSVRLLGHLIADLGADPVAFVVTCRDGIPGPLTSALPELLRGDAVRALTLGGLSAEDVRRWLPLLGATGDARLASALRERTAGNPLLVRLAAEALAQAGADPAAALDRLMHERPELRRLVAAKVDRLAPAVRGLVDAAAVLSERIEPAVVAAMTEQPGDLLNAATASGVLLDAGEPGVLRFEHALVRDAVYAALPAARRADLHRRAAVALAEHAGESASGSIAHHWQRAAGPDAVRQCVHWAQRAEQQARNLFGYADAVRYARLAVDSARTAGADEAERARLHVRLAEALFLAADVAASVAESVTAFELAEAAGRPDLMAAAALVVQGIGDPGASSVIPNLCARALAMLPAAAHVLRARLQARIAAGICESEGGTRPAEVAAAALAEAEQSGDAAAILEAIAARHLAISVPQQVAERLELGRRAVELGATARQPVAALWGHLWRADAALQLGNLVEADREIVEIARVAQRRRSPLAQWHLHRFRAVRSALIGDFASAREENAAAGRLAAPMDDLSMIGMSYAFLLQLALTRGDPAELPPEAEAFVRTAPPMPLIRVALPIMHALQGDVELARAEFAELRHVPATFPLGVRWLGTILQVGIAAVLLGDAEVAGEVHRLYGPLTAYYSNDGSGAVFNHGALARLAADTARIAGRFDNAVTLYAQAVTLNERIGARPFTALSRLGWAEALLAQSGDLRQAGDLVAAAAAEFRRLDMPGHLAHAVHVGDAVAAARRAASPLSAREAEVARLVAQALSNREIAARLVLSERTVETHVRNILSKLGFTTRTEIATWTVRAGPASSKIGS